MLEDNLLKLKWGGSLWHIIKKDSLFHISREEQKQAEPIKHFIMILQRVSPILIVFLQNKSLQKKKKSHFEMLIMPFWRNLLSSWKVHLIWVFLLLALLLKIETKYYLFVRDSIQLRMGDRVIISIIFVLLLLKKFF